MPPPPPSRNLESLDKFRSYLSVLARGCVPRDLQARVGESDIVGQVLVRAVEGFGSFRGRSDGEIKAYLRRILANTVIDTMRAMRRAARDPRRELSIHERIEDTAVRLEHFVAAQASAPSEAASGAERRRTILRLLSSLPPLQYYVVEQRRLCGRSTREIAEELGKTEGAVRKLDARALCTLRRLLQEHEA